MICLLVCVPALADDADALLLADRAPVAVERASEWQIYAEGGLGAFNARNDGSTKAVKRLSLDLKFDKFLSPALRLQAADRLDIDWQDNSHGKDTINTLKEAYFSWQPDERWIADLGRINSRYGVATGYNPTDFFRAGALRSVVSIDPASLKRNRLGSVMVRGQALWNDGSLTALFSPKLAQQPSDGAFDADLGTTNDRRRWLLALSQQVSDSVNPQWLIYGEDRRSPQFGVNLTMLPTSATVAYVEWAGGRSPSQLSQALHGQNDTAFHSRATVGMTHTTAGKLSVTLEYDFNSAALDAAEWQALSRNKPFVYGQYRQWVQNAQELPTKKAVFLYAAWRDAMIQSFDLTAMARFNVADRSRLSWVEARYHFDRMDVALQWQNNSGQPGSEFGSAPQRRSWLVLLRHYLAM